ncbi:hypothetical protein ACRSLK_07985 [Halopseudomonas pachastrellae]|uniref:hypothetical protein n=1 Tax=Halopseudomonas pachastrellae TaxID=254161 RepID=UPI003D7E023C
MKKALVVAILFVASITSIAIIISIVNFWSSRSTATAMARQELSSILHPETKKETVINYLVTAGRPANDVTTHYPNGKCATARSGDFRWDCEYASYVSTGWHIEMFSIARPHIQVFFIFDEKDELVKSYTHVSYTFL